MNEDDLKDREALRRKALWTLAHLIPGDPSAAPVIDALDDVDNLERLDNLSVLCLGDVRANVQSEPHRLGRRIIRDSSIPQPWRERFLRASVGSTRVAEGAYSADWEKFLQEWEAEMRHLEKHRLSRASGTD